MLPGIDEWLLGLPKNAAQADIRDGLERYFALKGAGDFSESFVHQTFGDGRLEHENLELDTALKRKQLGIPQDTEDFNEITNMRKGSILAALGIRLDKAVGYPQQSNFVKSLGHIFEPVEGVLDGGRRAGASAGRAVLRRAVGGL